MPIVAALLFAFIAFCIFCSVAGVIVLGLSWHKIARYLKLRRERDLAAIRSYHSRLSLVVSELLARANELDQQSKYLPAETEAEWNRVYEKLGRALVLMGDTLIIIKQRVDEKNVRSGREVTLLLCREATWVSRSLLNFEQKLLTAEKLQLEQIKAAQEANTVAEVLGQANFTADSDVVSIVDAAATSATNVDTCDRSTTGDGGSPEGAEKSRPENQHD